MSKITLILSLSFHILILYIVYLYSRTDHRPASQIFVEYLPVSKFNESATSTVKTVQGARRSPKLRAKRPKGSDRGSLSSQLQSAIRTPVWSLHGVSSGMISAENHDGSVGSENCLKMKIANSRPLANIWSRIRSQIHYHQDFYVDRLQGNVFVRILVSPRGKLVGLSTIQGHSVLIEWVKTALANALSEDFLDAPLANKAFLNLNFRFAILPGFAPVQEYAYNGLNLQFDIFGRQNLEEGAFQSVGALFSQPKMTHVSEWNFSKRMEVYEHACYRANNPEGCRVLIENYRKLALHEETDRAKKVLEHLSESK